MKPHVLALAVASVVVPSVVRAEGERSPMFGGNLVAIRDAGEAARLAGVGLEATWWFGRLGVAVEGSRVWDLDSSDPRTTTFGMSARVLVFDRLMESLIDPRDVELGFELQGVVERVWWQGEDVRDATNRYGVGIAIRLRGGGDAALSTLLAESRLFVRVLASPDATEAGIARSAMPTMTDDRTMTVIVGLGAAWGMGQRRYVDRFRMRPLDAEPFVR